MSRKKPDYYGNQRDLVARAMRENWPGSPYSALELDDLDGLIRQIERSGSISASKI